MRPPSSLNACPPERAATVILEPHVRDDVDVAALVDPQRRVNPAPLLLRRVVRVVAARHVADDHELPIPGLGAPEHEHRCWRGWRRCGVADAQDPGGAVRGNVERRVVVAAPREVGEGGVHRNPRPVRPGRVVHGRAGAAVALAHDAAARAEWSRGVARREGEVPARAWGRRPVAGGALDAGDAVAALSAGANVEEEPLAAPRIAPRLRVVRKGRDRDALPRERPEWRVRHCAHDLRVGLPAPHAAAANKLREEAVPALAGRVIHAGAAPGARRVLGVR